MTAPSRPIGVGLLGAGVVGSGVARILREKADIYARQIGAPLEIRRVLVRDLTKQRDVEIPSGLYTTNPADLIEDDSIDLIIEVTGAGDPAFGFLRDALNAKKFVVTANKEVMAKHGGELLRLLLAHPHVEVVQATSRSSAGKALHQVHPNLRGLADVRFTAGDALEPVDMRFGFERLSGMVRERMGYEPRSGALFVFVGKRRQLVKILFADATGICVFAKRLDRGVYSLPAAPAGDVSHVEIEAAALDALLDGLELAPSSQDPPPRRTRVRRVH